MANKYKMKLVGSKLGYSLRSGLCALNWTSSPVQRPDLEAQCQVIRNFRVTMLMIIWERKNIPITRHDKENNNQIHLILLGGHIFSDINTEASISDTNLK